MKCAKQNRVPLQATGPRRLKSAGSRVEPTPWHGCCSAVQQIFSPNRGHLMLTKLKVPYVVHNNTLVVIGEAAFEQRDPTRVGVEAG